MEQNTTQNSKCDVNCQLDCGQTDVETGGQIEPTVTDADQTTQTTTQQGATNKSLARNVTLKLCITAMFSAMIVGGKQALAAIPNVEIVTLLIALCGYVWGLSVAIPAVLVFIAVDTAIWGVNTWVISYLIHWNVVAIAFWLLSKVKTKNNRLVTILATVLAVALTLCFGVLTSAVDTLIGFTGKGFFVDFSQFFKRFGTMYLAGISFFVTHIVSNALLFAVSFVPLTKLNRKLQVRLFS